MIYGYARVSSVGQKNDGNSLEAQGRELTEKGAEVIFSDAFTGTKEHRPELDKLLSVLCEGDTLVVTKLDRISRSVRQGIDLINGLLDRGVRVHVLNMGLMDNTPTGKLIRTIMLAFAEFERDMIQQRTMEGKQIARQRPGYKEGRKRIEVDEALFSEAVEKNHAGEMTAKECCAILGISRTTWYERVGEYSHGVSQV